MKLKKLLFLIILSSCSNEPGAGTICVNKGIQYYKDIGSYPRLSDGKLADIAAQEKCLNSTAAFDSIH